MRSEGENLVKMANQIGTHFASLYESDTAAGAQAIAAHLKMFWAPAMRRSLLGLQRNAGADAVLPLVRQALTEHAGELLSASARIESPSNEVFPKGGGDAG